jgi:hypothetical protein
MMYVDGQTSNSRSTHTDRERDLQVRIPPLSGNPHRCNAATTHALLRWTVAATTTSKLSPQRLPSPPLYRKVDSADRADCIADPRSPTQRCNDVGLVQPRPSAVISTGFGQQHRGGAARERTQHRSHDTHEDAPKDEEAEDNGIINEAIW